MSSTKYVNGTARVFLALFLATARSRDERERTRPSCLHNIFGLCAACWYRIACVHIFDPELVQVYSYTNANKEPRKRQESLIFRVCFILHSIIKMKFCSRASAVVLALASSSAYGFQSSVQGPAFVGNSNRAAIRSSSNQVVLAMAGDNDDSSPSLALVAVNEASVEFTAGIVGGALGFAIGGPVLGAAGAAAANFLSKQDDGEINEIIQTVAKSTIEIYNYIAKMDAKYEVLESSKKTLQAGVDKIKGQNGVDPETIAKAEDAISKANGKLGQLSKEYDFINVAGVGFGVVGDIVEKGIKKGIEFNKEYKLTDRAASSIEQVLEKAKDKL